MHAGHKALFFDRLDVGVADSSGTTALPRLVPCAHTLVHNRNRAYIPALGRFLQADPNATAMALLEATSYHGRGTGAIALAFSTEERYGDGMNLYQYLGSNPWTRSDPLGLSYDPFSMVDEYIAADIGSKRAFLENIIGGAHIAAYVGAYIASYLPIPIASLMGEIGLALMDEPDALADHPVWQGVKHVEGLAGLLSNAASVGIEVAVEYARRATGGSRFLGASSGGLMGAARSHIDATNDFNKWLNAGPRTFCVYIGRAIGGGKDVVYAGKSGDFPRRKKAWATKYHTEILASNLTENQALSLETTLIARKGMKRSGGALDNRIFSVGKRRNVFLVALAYGFRWLSKNRPDLD